MCGLADGKRVCGQQDVCPVFSNPADRHFCPQNEHICEQRSGLPSLLARYRKVSPSDSVEMKIASNILKLHTTISRLKEPERQGPKKP